MHLCSVPRQKCQGGGAAVAAASAASHRTLRWYKGPALPPAATENNSSFSSYINSCSRSCANIRKNCLSAIPSNACSGGNCYSYFIRKEKERSPTQGGSPSWQKGRLPSAYLYSKDSDSDLFTGTETPSSRQHHQIHICTELAALKHCSSWTASPPQWPERSWAHTDNTAGSWAANFWAELHTPC